MGKILVKTIKNGLFLLWIEDAVPTPPYAWAYAVDSFEGAVEGGLIGESALDGDVGEGQAGPCHEIPGPVDAAFDQPSIGRPAKGGFEGLREVAYGELAGFGDLAEGDVAVEMRLQELGGPAHLEGREAATELRQGPCDASIGADEMTVQSVQNMVEEDLRGVLRMFERREKGVAEVIDDRVEGAEGPCETFHARGVMGVGDVIESRLRDVEHERVKGGWEQDRRLFPEIDGAHGADWIEAARDLFVAEELFDKRDGLELQDDDVATFPGDGLPHFGETFVALNPSEGG